jgi:hypothetical protein
VFDFGRQGRQIRLIDPGTILRLYASSPGIIPVIVMCGRFGFGRDLTFPFKPGNKSSLTLNYFL